LHVKGMKNKESIKQLCGYNLDYSSLV